jgi:hypothetical protein
MNMDWKSVVGMMVVLLGLAAGVHAQPEGSRVRWLGSLDEQDSQQADLKPESAELPSSLVSPIWNPSSATLFSWTGEKSPTDLSGPLVTDRPDFTEASSTVGRGILQMEMGYTYTYDHDGTAQKLAHSYPEILLRYGVLADWLEFRIAANFAAEKSGGLTISGSEDLYLGFKIGLTPQHEWLPETALIPQMTVPSGSDDFSNNEVLPGVNLVYSWDLTDRLSTAGSTQFNSALDGTTSNDYAQWAQSWAIGYSLTDQLSVYTEWYAFFPHGADNAKEEHYLNGGFARLIGDNLQWDIRGGVGLNEVADDYFLGTGLSIRFQ